MWAKALGKALPLITDKKYNMEIGILVLKPHQRLPEEG